MLHGIALTVQRAWMSASLSFLAVIVFVQETLIASVRAETLNIDASALNSGKAFSRVASKFVLYSHTLAQNLVQGSRGNS